MDARVWSATQYVKFENERTRPARDLLAQVPLETAATVVDLGCGPGNSTQLLAERFPEARVIGLDSSEDMLVAARERLPDIEFIAGDAGTWVPDEPVDLIFANALFQWVPDHLAVLVKLMDSLKPGGVLAVQMPDNLGEPTHLLMEEVANSGPWAPAFAKTPAKRMLLPAPASYFEALWPKAASVDVWHTIYNHPLADAAAIVEWLKGTGLKSYLKVLSEDEQEPYLATYQERVSALYPPTSDGRVLLRFPRLFLVVVKP